MLVFFSYFAQIFLYLNRLFDRYSSGGWPPTVSQVLSLPTVFRKMCHCLTPFSKHLLRARSRRQAEWRWACQGGRSYSPRVLTRGQLHLPTLGTVLIGKAQSLLNPSCELAPQNSATKQVNNSTPLKALLILQTHLHSAIFNQYISWLHPPAPTPSSNSGSAFKMHMIL